MAGFEQLIPLKMAPGVSRDTSVFDGTECVDMQHCRSYYGDPRKIGGYRNITNDFFNITRGMWVISANGLNNFYVGDNESLSQVPVDGMGNASSRIPVTPSGFAANPNNIWQFDDMFDVGSSAKIVFAHAGQNLAAIDNTINTPVYYGQVTTGGALTSTGQSVSGGVCVIHPYAFLYGNDGFIQWPAAGTVDYTLGDGDAGSARITGSKIIKGASIRGGAGYSPAGLFWSLDSLNRIYYVGGASVFANERIGSTYLLSSSAVVEYNGQFYWPSADGRFCMWNGGINDIPNNQNLRYFFDNLNYVQRQKVWGIKVPQFNEIWWHYPSNNSVECNKVIIYNVKDNVWYDSILGRSCGISSRVFQYPVMFGNVKSPNIGSYRMWQHEYGFDEQDGNIINAIPSWFESQVYTLIDKGQDSDKWTYLKWFEPDFYPQSGDLQLTITGTQHPQSGSVNTSETFILTPTTGKQDMREQRRLLRVRIESNTRGGNYYMGKPLMKFVSGNARTDTEEIGGS